MHTRKVTIAVIISIILLLVVAAVFMVSNSRKMSQMRNSDGWKFYDGVSNSMVKIFTSPRPARKIVFWNNGYYLATAGGIFKIDSKNFSLESSFTTANGLPSNDIRDALVSNGNLFLATRNGLAILEPSGRIMILKNIKNPAANRINDISIDDEKLLLCTDSGAFTLDNFDVKTIASNARFIASAAVPDGFIIGNGDGQLWFTDVDTIQKLPLNLPRLSSITLSNGKVFAATGAGAFSFGVGDENYEHIDDGRTLITAVIGSADSVWVCGFWGADLLIGGKRKRTIDVPLQWGGVRDVFKIDGEIVLGGDGGIIDEDGNNYSVNAPPENRITAICKHRGKIWVGTFSSGIATFSGINWKIPRIKLPSQFVNSIVSDGEYLWVGTDNGLVMAGGKSRVFKKRDGINSSHITALFYDGKKLWVGTNRGVCCQEGFGWRQFYMSDGLCGDHIYSIASKNDVVWVAAYGGVSKISKFENECFRKADGALKNDWATAVAMCDDGIFVGTYGGGISRFDGEKWLFYAEKEIVNPNAVAIVADRPIFGTAGNGLLVWDGNRFFKITSEDGLPNNEILSIFGDNEYIWVGTTDGLVKIPSELIIR